MAENTDTQNTDNPNVRLEEGQDAPEFSLLNADGETVSLSDYKGKKVIVYFYPKADTPGCTTEACDFRDSLTELNGQDVEVVGISPDKPDALKKFTDKYELTFPLLSDADKSVMKAFGAYGEKKNYGTVVEGVLRSTFVVDEQGNIALAKYNVKATGHVARIIKELEK